MKNTPQSSTGAGVAPEPSVRLDLWLWAARFARTRPLAKGAIEAGRVTVNGQVAKPSRALRVGDTLSAPRGDERFEVVIQGLASKRGSASVAQALYEETAASILARDKERALRRDQPQSTPPPSRPDKRSRRRLLDLLAGN